MRLWEIVIIAAGMSLDVFAYCLYKGAMLSTLKKAEIAKMCVIFVGFECIALLMGCTFTLIPFVHEWYRSVNRLWMILASVTFLCLGIYMCIKAYRRRNEKIAEKKADDFNYKVIAMWAMVTSVDALIAGVGFGFMGLELIATTAIVGFIGIVNVLLGIVCGYMLGCGARDTFVAVGGCLVIIGGLDVMVHYLYL